MPELPEVETIRLGLQKYLVGHKIERVEIKLPKIITGDIKNVEGAKITVVRRFGKGLVIDLSNKYSLAIHIKLTGQLIYQGPETKNVKLSPKVGGNLPNSRTHVIFKLKSQNEKGKSASQNSKVNEESDAYLYYNDLRQFGWIKILKTDEIFNLPFFRDLGPEPPVAVSFAKASKTKKAMEGQALLDLKLFKKIISASNMPIKPLIMDQKRIAGIGNIYANDGLWDARINPQRRAGTLTEIEIKTLYDSLLKVLKAGFKYKGASELNFVNAKGEEGEYQEHSLVYGRKGKKCKRCGREIKKIYFASRGTFYCPVCQK